MKHDMNSLALGLFRKLSSKVPRQIISESWSDREMTLREDVNLFCWKRTTPPALASFAEEVALSSPESIRQHVSNTDLTNQLAEARAQWLGVSALSGELFWEDVQQLTADFLGFAESQTGTLHLKVVSDGGCTKFHTDGYRLRLFTTYHGLGTEWLPETATNRAALGKSNEDILKDASQVQRIGAGHVSILKGELPYQNDQVKGIVHRSPPLEVKDQRRLILRIDI